MNSPHFMTDDSSLPCSQQPTMAPIMSHIISAHIHPFPRPSSSLLQVCFQDEGSLDYNIVKGKGKVYPRTAHESPEREKTYSSNLSLTLALDGVGGQRHAPAALPPIPIVYRWVGRPQGWTEWVRKISPPTGIRSPDRPGRRVSLYIACANPVHYIKTILQNI